MLLKNIVKNILREDEEKNPDTETGVEEPQTPNTEQEKNTDYSSVPKNNKPPKVKEIPSKEYDIVGRKPLPTAIKGTGFKEPDTQPTPDAWGRVRDQNDAISHKMIHGKMVEIPYGQSPNAYQSDHEFNAWQHAFQTGKNINNTLNLSNKAPQEQMTDDAHAELVRNWANHPTVQPNLAMLSRDDKGWWRTNNQTPTKFGQTPS